MFSVYKVGGVLLGVRSNIESARELLESVTKGWIMASGMIFEKKGF